MKENSADFILISQIARETPHSPEYLSLLVRKGRIAGKKLGRNWAISRSALAGYLASHSPAAVQNPVSPLSPFSSLYTPFKPVLASNLETRISQLETQDKLQDTSSKLQDSLAAEVKKELDELEEIYKERDTRIETPYTPSRPILPIADKQENIENIPSESKFAFPKISQWAKWDKGEKIGIKIKGPMRWAEMALVSILVLAFVLGGFNLKFANALYGAVKEFVQDAMTIQGHTPGTHANDILLLDKEGKVSIYGHIETQGQFRSYVKDGIAPIVIDSKTTVENLSADYLDNLSAQEFTLQLVTKNGPVTYDNVKLEGGAEIGSLLKVKAPAEFLDYISVSKNLSVGTDLVVNGVSTLVGQIKALSGAFIAGRVTVTGDVDVSNLIAAQRGQIKEGGLTVSGSTQLNTLGVTGGASMSDLGISGNFSVAGKEISLGDSGADKMTINASSTFKGPFEVTGYEAKFGRGIEILASGLNVTGSTSITGNTTVTGNLTVSGSTSSGLNMGLGTSTPGGALGVKGAGMFDGFVSANYFTSTSSLTSWIMGQMGIGTTTPGAQMGVRGGILSEGFVSADYFTSTSTNTSWVMGQVGVGTTTPGARMGIKGGIISEGFVSADYFTSTSTNSSWIFGNFGIGTTTPGNKLAVDGDATLDGLYAMGTTTTSSLIATSTLEVRSTAYTGGLLFAAFKEKVGFGTSTPGSLLSVHGAGNIGELTVEGLLKTQTLTATSSVIAALGSASSPSYTFLGDTNTGIWSAAADTFNISTAGSERGRFDANGNFGVGVTSPIQAFHLAGQCVTGDTKLRRRRRKKKGQAINESQGRALREVPRPDLNQVRSDLKEGQYEYDEVAIKDIKAGDEIQSLHEATGRLVWSQVKALMDMGVKPIFRLSTATGKTIRTTGNHPYFVRVALDNQKTTSFNAAFGELKSVQYPGLSPISSIANKFVSKKAPVEGVSLVLMTSIGAACRTFVRDCHLFGSLACHYAVSSAAVDNSFRAVEGTGFAPVGSWMAIPNRYCTPPTALTLYHAETNETQKGLTLGEIRSDLETQGGWVEVKHLLAGMDIAIAGDDNQNAVWDKIVKIEQLPPEQVYDIEVAGTHNFVGNNIVAHNTYISDDITSAGGDINLGYGFATSTLTSLHGRLGLATTSPGGFFSIGAATNTAPALLINQTGTDSILVLDNSGTGVKSVVTAGQYFGIATSSPGYRFASEGDGLFKGGLYVQATSTMSSLIATSTLEVRSSAYTGGSLFNTFKEKIGVGTSTPGSLLSVHGVGNIGELTVEGLFKGGTLTATSSVIAALGSASAPSYTFLGDTNTGFWSAAADTFNISTGGAERARIDSSGNLGIGRTSPGYTLDVAGSAQLLTDINIIGGDINLGYGFATSTLTSLHGRLGLATTSPGGFLSIGAATTVSAFLIDQTGTGEGLTILDGGVTALVLRDGALLGIATSSPGYRFASEGDGLFKGGLYVQGTSTVSSLIATSTLEVRSTAYTGGSLFNTFKEKIGIGTSTPGSLLSVHGNANIGELTVEGQFKASFITATSTTNNTFAGALDVTESATSTFTGGVNVITTGGLSSATGLTITGGDILSSGKLTVTAAATSTIPQLNASTILTVPTLDVSTILKNSGTATSTFAGGLSLGTGGLNVTSGGLYVDVGDVTFDQKLVVNGNVGIGTTAPADRLQVQGADGASTRSAWSSATQLIVDNNANTFIEVGTGNSHYSGLSFSDTDAVQQGMILYDHGTALTGAADNMGFYTNGARAMTITSGGNVGIGTTTPWGLLDVSGLVIRDSGAEDMQLTFNAYFDSPSWKAHDTGASAYFFNGANGLSLYSAPSVAGGSAISQTLGFHQSTAGNVGIGDTGPNSLLTNNQGAGDGPIFGLKSSDVATGITSALQVGSNTLTPETDDYFLLGKSSATLGGVNMVVLAEDDALNSPFQINVNGGTANTAKTTSGVGLMDIFLAEHNGANAIADVTADGNVFSITARVGSANVARWLVDEDGDTYRAGTDNTFSDVRIKTNIAAIPYGLDVVRALEPKIFDRYQRFDFNPDGSVNVGGETRRLVGFLAQDVKPLIPEIVDDIDPTQSFYSIDYALMTPVLWRAIQELDASTTPLVSNIFVDPVSGNVGIGSTTPNYKLAVMGDVAATSFINISTRTVKKDIEYLDDADESSVLDKIRGTRVATYNYISDNFQFSISNSQSNSNDQFSNGESITKGKARLGLIAEEAPVEVLSIDGKGVDIYKLSSFILAGVKAQQLQIDNLETRISQLETQDKLQASNPSTLSSPVSTPSTPISTLSSAIKVVISATKNTLAAITSTMDDWANAVLASSTQLIIKSEDSENISYEVSAVTSSREEIIASGSATLVMASDATTGSTFARARIKFDASFTSLISETEPIKVIVTPTTRLNGGLYVHQKSRFGFEVREVNAYDEGGMFDWMVVARKKGGEDAPATSDMGQATSPAEEPAPAAPVEEPAPTDSPEGSLPSAEPASAETATTTEPVAATTEPVIEPVVPAEENPAPTEETVPPPAEEVVTPPAEEVPPPTEEVTPPVDSPEGSLPLAEPTP